MRKEKEMNLWTEIDHRYMTEESEGEDDSITVHELPWRSSGTCVTVLLVYQSVRISCISCFLCHCDVGHVNVHA